MFLLFVLDNDIVESPSRAKRREPRRHTLANGVDYNMVSLILRKNVDLYSVLIQICYKQGSHVEIQ